MDVSVVIPIKDERDNIRPLHEQLHLALDPLGIDFEIVFVDDGSTDNSYEVLETLAVADPSVTRVVRLRRNFGQSAAMKAGIDFAIGQVIVTMDGDLQNDPGDIPMLLAKLDEGYDAVFGRRAKRKDNIFRTLPSRMANWLIRKVTGVQIKDMGCTLRAMRDDLAKELPLYGEMHRFIPVLVEHYGARIVQMDVNHSPRTAGKTKYNMSRTFRVLLDLVTVKFMSNYLTRPMHMMGWLGIMSMFLGLVSLVATVCMRVVWNEDMTGNPLLLLSALLAIVGVQFISLGLIGEVLTRTYFESQGKTAYTVLNTVNLDIPIPRRRAA
ncbi:MAG: glycosyltransferase family 2 protein [Gemmataceae bacterium]